MTDLEERLTRLLHQVADDLDVGPVESSSSFPSSENVRRLRSRATHRWAARGFAAAAVVALLVGLLTVRGADRADAPAVNDSVDPSDRPASTLAPTPTPTEVRSLVTRPPATNLPANGAIVMNDIDTTRQLDPTGFGRTQTAILPATTSPWPGPEVSPDGTRAAYEANGIVRVRDLATGIDRHVARCVAEACSIAWSPSGTTLAINPDRRTIALFDADGDVDQVGQVVITLERSEPHIVDFTHDGERIVFVSRAPQASDPSTAALESIRLDGTDRIPILETDELHEPLNPYWIDVSPLDSTIGWIQGIADATDQQTHANDDPPLALQLRMSNIDGSSLRVVADLGQCFCLGFSPDFRWSPDGLQYAYYEANSPSLGELFVASTANAAAPRSIGTGSGQLIWLPELSD